MKCKSYYAKSDPYGFPIPGTMMGYDGQPGTCDIGLACNFVLLPAVTHVLQAGETQQFHPGKFRFFVVLNSKGQIKPNSLIQSFKVPQGVRTAEFIKYKTS